MIEDWCGKKLSYKEFRDSLLFKAIPEKWWGYLNPGTDLEREISPWEVERLASGRSSIPELLEEALGLRQGDLLTIKPLEGFEKLEESIRTFASGEEVLAQAYGALEEIPDHLDEYDSEQILLYFRINNYSPAESKDFEERLRAHVSLELIGDTKYKLFIEDAAKDSLFLGLFEELEPIFTRN